MSWAEEDWTVGLSGRVLQKVKELQVHQERLSRENKQKQLQLDNIHTSLEKQTVKVHTRMVQLPLKSISVTNNCETSPIIVKHYCILLVLLCKADRFCTEPEKLCLEGDVL